MPRIAPGARLRLFAQGEAFASALGHYSRLAGSLQPTSLPFAPASQPREGPEREHDLNGHVEVFGDLQGKAERGRVLAPLQVADRLVVDSQGLGEFATTSLEESLRARIVDEMGVKPRLAFGPLRVAVTGRQVSPPLFESMEILGRESSLARLRSLRASLA